MKGVLFIGMLIALLIVGYLTFERMQNPKDQDDEKTLIDMPNMMKDKAENLMNSTQERYDEAMEMDK